MIGTRPPSWPYYLNPETTQAYGVVAAYLGANGGNTLYDLGPTKQYHGTLTNGPTWTTGKFGEPAIDLDGSNDYVSIPSSAVGINEGTFACTTKMGFSAGGAAYRTLFDTDNARHAFYTGGGSGGQPWVFYNDARFRYYAENFTAGDVLHLAWVWQKSTDTQQLYIDGIAQTMLVGGPYGTWGATALGTNAYIGRGAASGGSDSWLGSVYRPTIFSKALTANQISELYRNPFLLYWQPSPVRTFWMGAAPAAPGGLSIPIAAYHYNHSLRA